MATTLLNPSIGMNSLEETVMNPITSSYNSLQYTIQTAMAKVKGANPTGQAQFDASVSVTTVTATASTAATDETPRTVDDVKKEFYDYLDSLQLSPGLSTTGIGVNVTEAAFEKMLKDPDYMQKMKDLCARDLCDPNWTKLPPTGIQITIDADVPEEYLASSWNAPGVGTVDETSFWNKKSTDKTEKQNAEKKAKEKRQEKIVQEKREMLEFLQKRADERKIRADGVVSSYANLFSTSYSGIAKYASPAASPGSLFGTGGVDA
ncbi:MAG: hypothetical protein LIQ31_06670 [Planctomycetes bacterium]|nr:hypothetical protein [Planctomycetota bacterium]